MSPPSLLIRCDIVQIPKVTTKLDVSLVRQARVAADNYSVLIVSVIEVGRTLSTTARMSL